MTELYEEAHKIYVKNIPLGTRREEVIQLFQSIGPVDEVILPRPKPNHATTYGFVTFEEGSDVQKAIKQYNKFLYCNSQGRKAYLDIVKAYRKVGNPNSPPTSLSYPKDFKTTDKIGTARRERTDSLEMKGKELEQDFTKEKSLKMRGKELEQDFTKERNALLKIIEENDFKIKEMEKKKISGNDLESNEKKEQQLLEELQRLPERAKVLKDEIEVLTLQVKLKELETEQSQILNQSN